MYKQLWAQTSHEYIRNIGTSFNVAVGIPVVSYIIASNAVAWLYNAILRFFGLAEQCHTRNFYPRCFKSYFDAVKSKFGLLIDHISRRQPQNEGDLNNEDNLKNLKNEEDLKSEDDFKYEDDLKH